MQTFEASGSRTNNKRKSLHTLIKSGKNKLIRLGDVLLMRVQSPAEIKNPEKFIATGNTVVQEGEKTGHAHRLGGNAQTEIFANLDNPDERYVAVFDGEATLSHEEHKPVTIEEGLYKVVIEREFDPTTEVVRRVYD
jgi:hypothetical protein